MKIPNYDKHCDKKQKRRLNNLLDEEYRMLIYGQSGCGKTNTVVHMLMNPLVYYDEIYLFTPNQHQDKIRDLISTMDDISKKVGYNVLTVGGEDDIPKTSEYPEGSLKIVIFDDLINAKERVQSKIADHFTDGRHHQISPIYLSQSYYDVPQKIRLNCSHMALYPPVTKNNLNLIGKENMINPHLFNRLGPYEFLFLNIENKSVKKNFNENM